MTKKNKRWISLKPLIALGFFLVLFWMLPPFIKSALKVSLGELHAPVWVATSHLQDIQKYWGLRSHSKKKLVEACRDLARKNAYLELQLQEQSQLGKEKEALESLLKLPEHKKFYYEIARVCRRDSSAWWERLLIRKGKNYGIPEGAGVVYNGGVVGKIVKVNNTTSVVELVTSPLFRTAAHLKGDRRPVSYRGNVCKGFSVPTGNICDVPSDMELQSGQPLFLVSSALGGIFPDGIAIGKVMQLDADKDGLFLSGKVELSKQLLNLEEVAILMPLEPDAHI